MVLILDTQKSRAFLSYLCVEHLVCSLCKTKLRLHCEAKQESWETVIKQCDNTEAHHYRKQKTMSQSLSQSLTPEMNSPKCCPTFPPAVEVFALWSVFSSSLPTCGMFPSLTSDLLRYGFFQSFRKKCF